MAGNPKTPAQRRDDALKKIGRNFKRNREAVAKDVRTEKEEGFRTDDSDCQSNALDIVEEIEVAAEAMTVWGGKSASYIGRHEDRYLEDRQCYDRAIGRAIRHGLFDYPDVQLWLEEQRSLGERDILRKVQKGLETGTSRPISKENFWVKYHAIQLFDEDLKPEEIRRRLINKLLLDSPEPWFNLSVEECDRLVDRLRHSSRQNFHKWLKRLGVT